MAKKKSVKRNPKRKKAPAPTQAEQEPQARPLIRAIRVSQEVLDAAKAYKKATGTSFYTLGFEAIAERLKREGYLKTTEAGA